MATFYEEVLDGLDAAQVRFVLVGGLAVILHGVPRTTADMDIVLDLERENVQRFVQTLERLGFRPRAPVDPAELADASVRESWIRDKNLKAFTMTRGGIEDVDVLLDSPFDHAALLRTSTTYASQGVNLSVAGIDELIEMKLRAGRPRDHADVAALRKIKIMGGS